MIAGLHNTEGPDVAGVIGGEEDRPPRFRRRRVLDGVIDGWVESLSSRYSEVDRLRISDLLGRIFDGAETMAEAARGVRMHLETAFDVFERFIKQPLARVLLRQGLPEEEMPVVMLAIERCGGGRFARTGT